MTESVQQWTVRLVDGRERMVQATATDVRYAIIEGGVLHTKAGTVLAGRHIVTAEPYEPR